MAVSDQRGIHTTVPTRKGTFACPNHGGGVEWNGGSYDPASNLFLMPSTQECAVWKVATERPVPYIPGQPYSAGPLPKRRPATGGLTAIDIGSGSVRWHRPLPYSAQGGVLVTKPGIAFTTDLRGRIYAFDIASGKELWHDDIGSSVVAPISAYRSGGSEYVAVIAGEAPVRAGQRIARGCAVGRATTVRVGGSLTMMMLQAAARRTSCGFRQRIVYGARV